MGIIYHMLKNGVAYQDLGGDYFERREPERLKRYLVKRLERLGYRITVEQANQADELVGDPA